MAKSPAIFSGPIEIMDVSSGKQVALPLSDVFFLGTQINAQGTIYTNNKKAFDDFLGHLVKTGAITAGPPPPTQPVMVVKAKTPGSSGNAVLLEFKNFDTGANPKFDAAVSETDTYTSLQPDKVQTVLGSTASNGSRPGLVFVPGTAPAATAIPKAGVYTLAGATAATADIPLNTGSGTAFKVQAKGDGADGALTSVEIKDVDTTASTFTLVATWKKAAAAKIAPADIGTTFAYEITVAPPQGAAAVGTPAPGAFTLSGGADAGSSSAASATITG